MSPRVRDLLPWAVGLLVFLSQLPSLLAGGFVWDDVPLLLATDLYTDAGRLGEAVSGTLGGATNYWRPLATSSFLVDAELLGGSAAAFHAVQALLHGLTSALLVVIAGRLGARWWAAALAGLLFGLHPVTVEPATWISGRFDVLAGLFTALALLCVVSSGGRTRLQTFGAAGAVLAACLSKESGYVLPAVLGAVAWAVTDEGRVRAALQTAGSAAVGVVVALALRLAVLGDLPGTPAVASEGLEGPVDRLLLVGRTVVVYVRLVVWPWGSVGPAHHVERPVATGDVLAWAGVALLLIAGGWVFARLRAGDRAGGWAVAVGVAVAPVLQLVPLDLGGELAAADRFLYVPLLLLVVGVVSVLPRTREWTDGSMARALAPILLVVLAFLPYRVLLVQRWESDRTLFTWMVETAPGSSLGRLGLYQVAARGDAGVDPELDLVLARDLVADFPGRGYDGLLADALLRRGRSDEARDVLLAAPEMSPPQPELLLNEGELLLALGATEAAETRYRTALRLVRGDEAERFARLTLRATAGAAVVAGRLGETRLREARLTAAVQTARSGFHVGGQGLLVLALVEAGRFEEAAQVATSGPKPAERWLVSALESAGRTGASMDVCRSLASVAEPPESVRITRLDALGRGLGAAQRWEEAAALYAELVELAPDRSDLRDHLGFVLFGTGDVAGAERELRRAVELDGENAWAHHHLGLLLDRTERADEGRTHHQRARELARASGDQVLLAQLEAVLGD